MNKMLSLGIVSYSDGKGWALDAHGSSKVAKLQSGVFTWSFSTVRATSPGSRLDTIDLVEGKILCISDIENSTITWLRVRSFEKNSKDPSTGLATIYPMLSSKEAGKWSPMPEGVTTV
jgi:hypothetical protein